MSLKATTLKGRLAMILGDGEGADVHFLVGEGAEKELIAAHKVLLIPASEVFRAMFRFDQQNSNFGSVDNPVEVPDVEAAAFKVMLRFIYTDGLSGLNGDNAMAVLYAVELDEDENWSRKCSAIFRIIGQGNGTEDFIRKFEDEILNRETNYMGWKTFITFSELMDSSKGLYDQRTDKVTLAIDVTVNNV
ncbi:hypothetical protein niasHS_016814 [Heterodera schachtii]|uniref:BTB domain-containing protein n=1 Tax=Heterodera schachtii TaxID=97005 RepID=A0ABD2I416_HETSC